MIPAEEIIQNGNEIEKLLKLFENYVDNFIAVVQVKTNEDLYHTSRALLYSIDSIFQEEISVIKLYKERK